MALWMKGDVIDSRHSKRFGEDNCRRRLVVCGVGKLDQFQLLGPI